MSVLNHELKHIFVHIPRTGGTSMEAASFVGGSGHHFAWPWVRDYPDYFSWAFVRNPYDRFISVFHYHMKHDKPPHFTAESLSECAWLLIHGTLPTPGFYRQVDYIGTNYGDILVDFVGRFEQLKDDWRTVCKRVGVKYEPMVWINKTDHATWSELLTNDVLKIINDYYLADFKVFNYPLYRDIDELNESIC